jgi:outer membrane protein assembly factor BamB
VLFARPAAIRGALRQRGDRLFATVDQRGAAAGGQAGDVGMAAFDRLSGELVWQRTSVPPLAAMDGERLYGYARAGSVVAVGFDGEPRWRASLPDDRGEGARRRGMIEGPFVADVAPGPAGVVLAAGAEVLRLGPGDGVVRARTAACPGSGAAVARMARAGDTVLCTCTVRTAEDDEVGAAVGGLWEAPRELESFRTEPGDLVALDADLRQRWRLPPPAPDFVWANRAPVPAPDGGLVLVASTVARAGALGLFDDRLVLVDASDGRVRWAVPTGTGRSRWDPVVCERGIVAGTPPAMFDLADGRLRWRLAEALAPDPGVRPVAVAGMLYAVQDGRVLVVGLDDGRPAEVAVFAHRPLAGAVTTELLIAEGIAYLGVEDGGRRELRAVRLGKGWGWTPA